MSKELETEFDPTNYDKIMTNTFNDGYYEVEEDTKTIRQIKKIDEDEEADELEKKHGVFGKSTLKIPKPDLDVDMKVDQNSDEEVINTTNKQ